MSWACRSIWSAVSRSPAPVWHPHHRRSDPRKGRHRAGRRRIWREEIAKAGLDKEINQYYAALTNMRSVGVMGDERTYDYAVALRAVTTTDFMTAESYNMPWDVLALSPAAS